MNFIVNCFKGIAIGAGAIIPGVSSGVICVILGIYEKLLDKILNIFKDLKNNLKFLIPIGLGIGIGVVLFGNILKYLFYTYPYQTNFTFIGLILGCLPTLFKQTSNKGEFKLHYILYLVIATILGILMVFIEKNILVASNTEFEVWYLVLSGMCMSIGVVVPGVSSTIILMLFGVYSAYLTSIAEVYFPILIPMGIGLVIGSIICMKVTKLLLEKFYMQTFYSIIGFTIGSVFVIYPGFSFDINGVNSILCLLLGIFVANIFEK